MDTNNHIPDATKMMSQETESCSRSRDAAGSHPRVEYVLNEWLLNDTRGLTFGTEKEKAASWQKCASRLEKLARQLESELYANAKD